MFEKIKEIVADQLGIDAEDIKLESNFKEDLEADSLDLFELVMSLEEEYGVEIPSEDLEKIETVNDIIEYLKEANYINDKEYIEKAINNFMVLKNLSIKEIKYKLISKGLDKNKIEDYICENKEELEEYEIKSAENIFYKKTNSMEDEEIKQYLLKKGYKSENISIAMENFNE